jgi:acetyl-CoA carboxylase carboxyltransferase component
MPTHDDLLNELNQHREQIAQGGGAARIEAQHAKGKFTARERIACLLDGRREAILFHLTRDCFVAHNAPRNDVTKGVLHWLSKPSSRKANITTPSH